MKKKLVFWNSLIVALSLVAFSALGIVLARNALLQEAESHTISLTQAYASAFDGDTGKLTPIEGDIRETVLNSKGDVLWDSEEDASKMGNHADRQEVAAAISGNPCIVRRSSKTMGTEFIYYALAKPINEETFVVRIALRTSSLTRFITGGIPWAILGFVLAISLSVFGVYRIVNRSMKPLKSVEENLQKVRNREPLDIQSTFTDDEVGKISKGLCDLSVQLNGLLKENEAEKRKLQLVLNAVPNPIFALGENNEILLRNPSAERLFPLCGNRLEEAGDWKEGSLYTQVKENKVYLVHIQETESFRLVVLDDVTLSMQEENRRKEFVDAASHELKTPLTSIRGFSNLIEMTSQDENITRYSHQIDEASERMSAVLSDMLTISLLEEGKTAEPVSNLDFGHEATQLIEELQPLCAQKEITITQTGSFSFPMEEKDAHSLLKNLLENAVLYNVPGGLVTIQFLDDGFLVKDTGIGIPLSDQSRVFERFYRVDKSRSRENGGTGLGLSIVKHVVQKYKGTIQLESTPGFGTTITVRFPKSSKKNL